MQPVDAVTADVEHWLRPDSLLGAIGYLVIFCALAWLLSRALRIGIETAVSHGEHMDRTAANFLRQLGVVIIWGFVLAAWAHLVPALRDLGTAMLAGASVASIVLGLAAQSTLGNLIAGISILIYRPFRLGDLLQVSGPAGPEIGTVELLSLGYTILSTQDGRRVIIPNSVAISQIALNLNAYASGSALVVHFWVVRESVRLARTLAMDLARDQRAEVIGCFVGHTEPAAVELSLAMRQPADPALRARIEVLPQRLAAVLASHGVASPPGKDAPMLVTA